ncbi:hypothetical protein HKI87_12g72000 [Chloropicon roscoffensis]|uniref:F-box domain-containing protein n=1 Tax=Chloropicon roscoffensis TaxID=1461544 RepID=A0AAX4PHZ9_9CHLO
MSCGAGEPSTKRAKVDEEKEAKEEEDRLVRRREELVLMDANARANARAKRREVEEGLVREAMDEAERLKREAEDEAERLKREAEDEAERLKREAEAERLKRGKELSNEASRLFGPVKKRTKREKKRLKQEIKELKREAKREADRLKREADILKRKAEDEAERLKREAAAKGERMVREAKERAMLKYDRTLSEARLSFAHDVRSVCADLEAKNEKRLSHFRHLPLELWQIINKNLHQNDLLALAMTCRFFRDTTKEEERKLKTHDLLDLRKNGKMASHSMGWFQWVCDTWEIQPCFKGSVYEGDLLNCAALEGSVEILRWLVEEKGWELNRHTDWYAGLGGSVEVLEYLVDRGYKFKGWAFSGAASEGHLEALRFLRGLYPPCPWSRSEKGLCREEASRLGHQHVTDWIDQQEDESDASYTDSFTDSYGDEYF